MDSTFSSKVDGWVVCGLYNHITERYTRSQLIWVELMLLLMEINYRIWGVVVDCNCSLEESRPVATKVAMCEDMAEDV